MAYKNTQKLGKKDIKESKMLFSQFDTLDHRKFLKEEAGKQPIATSQCVIKEEDSDSESETRSTKHTQIRSKHSKYSKESS